MRKRRIYCPCLQRVIGYEAGGDVIVGEVGHGESTAHRDVREMSEHYQNLLVRYISRISVRWSCCVDDDSTSEQSHSCKRRW